MLSSYLLRDNWRETGFSLVEVGEIIRRKGVLAGYDVVAEYPIKTKGDRRSIDWVWLKGDAVVLAIEIEGCNAPRKSIQGDIEKFTNITRSAKFKPYCLIVTYSRRYTKDRGWVKLKSKADRIKSYLQGAELSVLDDIFMLESLDALKF